ncbi:unnamed protein product [Umbelopsis ramanniana]
MFSSKFGQIANRSVTFARYSTRIQPRAVLKAENSLYANSTRVRRNFSSEKEPKKNNEHGEKESKSESDKPFNIPKGFEGFFGRKAADGSAKRGADEAAKQHAKKASNEIPKPPPSGGKGNGPPEFTSI